MKASSLAISLTLLVAVIFTAVNYIYLQHESRKEFAELQSYLNEEKELNTEWGKLQIEHSTLVANSRIESKARSELDMFVPQNEEIIKITR